MKIERRKPYAFNDSLDRIDRMLDGYVNDKGYGDEIKKAKMDLSMKTGALVSGTCLVITFYAEGDVPLIKKMKVLRAFSSEVISLLTANGDCSDIYAYGNKIMAVCDTPLKTKIERVVDNAASICSLSDVINRKSGNSGYPLLKVSTGMDFGDMLMMRFCEFDGRDMRPADEVQYIGPLIERAEMLCHRGFESVKSRIYISGAVFRNLSLDYQKFFHKLDDNGTSYSADLHNVQMNNWLCK